MKKYFLLFVLALAASVMQAQNGELYLLLYHGETENYYSVYSMMQQRDGDFIMDVFVHEDIGDHVVVPWGNMFYKVSSTTLAITDSLFVTDTIPRSYLFAQNPSGGGNIRANFEYHAVCDSTFLRICYFPDDDLHANPEEDVVVPVCEGLALNGASLIDCWGDLIMEYGKERPDLGFGIYDNYIARIGSDGTLKQQALSTSNCEVYAPRMRVLKESPLQYYQWGSPYHFSESLGIIVIDSLFQNNLLVFSNILSEEVINPYQTRHESLTINYGTEVIPIGGNEILVAAEYTMDTNNYAMTAEYGVAVAKYDIRTAQLKDYIVFNDYPSYYHEAKCMGLKMMTDGTVYFLYKEEGYPDESVNIVKMDTNLNVDWKRFCKTGNVNMSAPFVQSVLYAGEQEEEKCIAWIGHGYRDGSQKAGVVLFLLNHDGPVNVVSESGIEVRPYAYYPNPARDQLHMEFSPDVQPAQVELYDLQGRLVRTQSKAFGNIDMSQLPAGTYTMRVIMEDGMTYSDKVVKE